jgi:hypothetical protein
MLPPHAKRDADDARRRPSTTRFMRGDYATRVPRARARISAAIEACVASAATPRCANGDGERRPQSVLANASVRSALRSSPKTSSAFRAPTRVNETPCVALPVHPPYGVHVVLASCEATRRDAGDA